MMEATDTSAVLCIADDERLRLRVPKGQQMMTKRTKRSVDQEGDRVRQKAVGADRKHDVSSDSFCQKILASVSEAIVIIDLQNQHIIDANEKAQVLYGYTRDEILNLTSDELTAEPRTSREFSTDEPSRERILVPVRYHRRKDGALVPVEIRARRFEAQGRIVLCAAIREISRNAGPVDVNPISTELYRNLVENAGVAIEIDNELGEFRYCNERFAGLFGYSLDEIKHKSIQTLVHPDDVEEVVGRHLARFSGKKEVPTRYEFRGRHADGTTIYIEVDVVELREGEQLVGTRSYLWDVTERMNAETKLRNAIEAGKAAQQAKARFLDNVTHEVRTPMNVTIGMIDLVLRSELNDRQRHQLTVARKAAAGLMALLSDIVDYASIDAGHFEPQITQFEVRKVVLEVVENFKAEIEKRSLDLFIDFAKDVPIVLNGDRGRLRQVLVNLIGNAVKFTDHGFLEIRVTLQQNDEKSVMLRFEVGDTGVGIESGMLDTINDVFTQEEDHMGRRFGGIGLGLPLSQRLVQLLGGEMAIESIKNLGTLVRFTASFEDIEASPSPTQSLG